MTSSADLSEKPAQFTLEPSKLDFGSIKTQFLAGLILLSIAALAVYGKTLGVGWLGDDFLHIDYVYRAFNGDWQPFLNNFSGNWAGSEVMKSYRPLTSLSIFLDYLIWRNNAIGFHATNVLLLCGCALFTGLITLELTGQRGNRLGATAAIWSALLFVVYPLHAEPVAWMIGRVDLLCTLFYLASVFCYLRYRLLRESAYLTGSLVWFFAALACKEMAVTLPVVLFLAELFLFKPEKDSTLTGDETDRTDVRASSRFQLIINYIAALFLFATIRTLMLGTVIGGYGDSFSLSAGLRNLADKATLLKIIYPASEEQMFLPWVKPVLFCSYLACLSSFGARLLLRSTRWSPALFLLGWIVVAVVPALQVWHIYPNLSGSRLFYLSSAPFCMLLALMAVPALDTLKRKFVRPALAVALVSLSMIFACWSYLADGNVQVWTAAGHQLGRLRAQAIQLLQAATPGSRVLLADLPPDYKGAMMVGREQYLRIQLRAPFTPEDLSDRLLTLEPVSAGSHDFVWPGQIYDALQARGITAYRWSGREAKFVPFGTTTGTGEYTFDARESAASRLKFEPPSVILSSADKWRVAAEHASCVTALKDRVRIYPGKETVTVILPHTDIDPRIASVASLHTDITSTDGCKGCYADRVRIIWDAQSNDGTLKRSSAQLINNAPGYMMAWLGRYRDWTLSRKIVDVGITLAPGEYYADFQQLRLMPSRFGVPQLKVVQPRLSSTLQPVVAPANNTALSYDVSEIQGAQSALLVFTKPGTTFDATGEADTLSSHPTIGDTTDYQAQVTAPSTKGIATIPPAVLATPGIHQVRVIACGADKLPRGLPSEPVTLVVKEKESQSSHEQK